MKPTLQTIRKFHNLSYPAIARASGLRPLRIYMIEQSGTTDQRDVINIVRGLKALTGQFYRQTDISFSPELSTTTSLADIPTGPLPILIIPETSHNKKVQEPCKNNSRNPIKRLIARLFRRNTVSTSRIF